MNTSKITNNTMISWSVMLGVNPGYDSTAHLTPESAMLKAMPFIRHHLMKPGDTKISGEPAIAVYNRSCGCPDGGEAGVVIKGAFYPYMKKLTENSISNLMADLGLSTGTIEYAAHVSDFETLYSSTYVQNLFEENAEKSEDTLIKSTFTENESGIHFRIPFSSLFLGNMNKLGQLLQDQMDTLQDGEYTITGVLTNDGKNVYYEGTQNLVYAPNYRAYLVALNKVIEAMDECICGEPVIDYRE